MHRRIVTAFGLVLLATTPDISCARAKSPKAEDPAVTVLDPLVVTADRPDGPPWLYCKLPDFELLARVDSATMERLIKALAETEDEARVMMPESLLAPSRTSVSLIVYDSLPDGTIKIPAAVIDHPANHMAWGSDEGPGILDSNGGFVGSQEGIRVAENLWMHEADVDARRPVQLLDTRMRLRTPSVSFWLTTGFFGDFGIYSFGIKRITLFESSGEVLHRGIVLPGLSWVSSRQTDMFRNAVDHWPDEADALLPAARFFAEEADPVARKTPLWQSQAALFVSWGMFADNSDVRHVRQFERFANLAAGIPVDDKLFASCFGFGLAQLNSKLITYALRAKSPTALEVSHHMEAQSASPATDVQIARIVGYWERLKGLSLAKTDPEKSRAYLDAAHKTLFKPYRNGSRDPLLMGAIGLCLDAEGHPGDARPFFEAGVRTSYCTPGVYAMLARSRLEQIIGTPPDPSRRLDPAQMARVAQPLLRATEFGPLIKEGFVVMTRAAGLAQEKPTEDVYQYLKLGFASFPYDQELRNSILEVVRKWSQPAAAGQMPTGNGTSGGF